MTSVKEILYKPVSNHRKVRMYELEWKLFDDSLIYKNDDELMDFQYNIIKTINKTQYRINNGLTKIPKTLMRKLDKLEEQIKYINYEFKFRLHRDLYFDTIFPYSEKYKKMYETKHIKCLDCKMTFNFRDYLKHKYKLNVCDIYVCNIHRKKHNYCLCGSVISHPHNNLYNYFKHLKTSKHNLGLDKVFTTDSTYYNNHIIHYLDEEKTEGYTETTIYVVF